MKKTILIAILLTLFKIANANTLDFQATPEMASKADEWICLLFIVMLIAYKKSTALR